MLSHHWSESNTPWHIGQTRSVFITFRSNNSRCTRFSYVSLLASSTCKTLYSLRSRWPSLSCTKYQVKLKFKPVRTCGLREFRLNTVSGTSSTFEIGKCRRHFPWTAYRRISRDSWLKTQITDSKCSKIHICITTLLFSNHWKLMYSLQARKVHYQSPLGNVQYDNWFDFSWTECRLSVYTFEHDFPRID